MSRRFAPTALMLGNFVTGTSVLAPAGMLSELASGVGVSIRDAGLLITFGAVVLCVGSPLTAWLTSRIERRLLLGGTLAMFAVTNFASAFAPDYTFLLLIRLVMPVIVSVEKRGGVIAYVFMGWSLAAAFGLPLVTFIASRYGWRVAYGGIGTLAVLSCLLLVWRLPRGLFGVPVDLKTWTDLARNRLIIMLLLITTLQMGGQFVVFTFMAPLLKQLTGAGSDMAGLVFAAYGVFGIVGLLIASRIVDSWGGYKTSLLFTGFLLAGTGIWAFGAGNLITMVIGVVVWGVGFSSTNSMQQVRLVVAAPALATASIALNTSVLYIGQALGSAIGGMLYARDLPYGPGYASVSFVALAIIAVIATRRMSSS
jgi:MFS transporter, DHA1 family, inner membrane transport protein